MIQMKLLMDHSGEPEWVREQAPEAEGERLDRMVYKKLRACLHVTQSDEHQKRRK